MNTLTRERYLEARRIMRTAPGDFYFDSFTAKAPQRRYMRTKHLPPADAYELYARMLNYFAPEHVKLYASTSTVRGILTKSPHLDTVVVTLTPYWPTIRR